ncbi:MAG: HesA/MoeB/ThiF family protein [Paracoccaceae bacterium]
MLWFLILALAFWGLGHLLRAPTALRWAMIGLLYLGVVLALWLLPVENGLRGVIGGTLTGWLVLGGVVAVVWLYLGVLSLLRARAADRSAPDAETDLQASELERNARHIVLRDLGGPGQQRLKSARILVIGAGGLGSAALQYLAAAGVGTIGVIDDDVVENSNLQRQVIHKDAAIGMPKVFSARAEMLAQNPAIKVLTYHRRLNEDIASDLIADFDLVLDGTDNFDTRYLVNRTCVALDKPLISGALSQWEGQISTFHPASDGPCYQCIFPQAPAPGLSPSCAEGGVLGPLPGVVGAMMAVEAIKEIAGAGQGLRGRMLIYDALYGLNRVIDLKPDPKCPVCG